MYFTFRCESISSSSSISQLVTVGLCLKVIQIYCKWRIFKSVASIKMWVLFPMWRLCWMSGKYIISARLSEYSHWTDSRTEALMGPPAGAPLRPCWRAGWLACTSISVRGRQTSSGVSPHRRTWPGCLRSQDEILSYWKLFSCLLMFRPQKILQYSLKLISIS